jgi:muramoyltetrapeptide carboxypeptidase
VLCAALGTPYAPLFTGKILFFEDAGEKPFRLDRMLTQLVNAGVLKKVAGIAVGILRNCEDPGATRRGEYRQTAEDVVKERLSTLGIPVVTGFPFGHIELNATLPVGAMARLDGDRDDLEIIEPTVH